MVYAFAVVRQHVTDDIFRSILEEWWRVLRPGGTVVSHVVVDGQGWKTEDDWRRDRSLKGRLKWRFGLHCFKRSQEFIDATIQHAGFTLPVTTRIRDITGTELDDDVADQHLCVFEKA